MANNDHLEKAFTTLRSRVHIAQVTDPLSLEHYFDLLALCHEAEGIVRDLFAARDAGLIIDFGVSHTEKPVDD